MKKGIDRMSVSGDLVERRVDEDGSYVVKNEHAREQHADPGIREPPSVPEGEFVSWPEPPAEDAYYGLAGDIVRAIEPHTESDPVAILIQLLVAFGNMIGRTAYFEVEATKHYTNLFAVIVGRSSKARKGTSQGHVVNVCEAVDEEWTRDRVVFGGLSSGEGLVYQVRNPVYGQERDKKTREVVDTVVDPGVDDKRLLVCEGEFANALKVLPREGNTLSPVIRNTWDRGDLQFLTKSKQTRATDAHISLVGHITVEELKRYLKATEAANGFANRFLWLCVKRSKLLPEGGKIDVVDFTPLRTQLREAVLVARQQRELRRDEEARAKWYEIYEELSNDPPGLRGALTSRAEAQVLRLSMLYALLDCSELIRREHLAAACALWKYCDESVRFIWGDALGDPVADEVLDALRNHPAGLTRTEIRDLFGRNKSADELAGALALLAQHGLAERSEGTGKGRSVELWTATRI